MDAGRFDIRWLGADLANPETQRFEAFLTDGGTPTSVMFPIYDLGPFLDLPETLDDVRNARQLCVTFVDAMRSGDLERCSSMASLDEEFLRHEQGIFAESSFERTGEPLWESDHFEIELVGRDDSGAIRSLLSLWFADSAGRWSLFRYDRKDAVAIGPDASS
jgi:hypothetical protein